MILLWSAYEAARNQPKRSTGKLLWTQDTRRVEAQCIKGGNGWLWGISELNITRALRSAKAADCELVAGDFEPRQRSRQHVNEAGLSHDSATPERAIIKVRENLILDCLEDPGRTSGGSKDGNPESAAKVAGMGGTVRILAAYGFNFRLRQSSNAMQGSSVLASATGTLVEGSDHISYTHALNGAGFAITLGVDCDLKDGNAICSGGTETATISSLGLWVLDVMSTTVLSGSSSTPTSGADSSALTSTTAPNSSQKTSTSVFGVLMAWRWHISWLKSHSVLVATGRPRIQVQNLVKIFANLRVFDGFSAVSEASNLLPSTWNHARPVKQYSQVLMSFLKPMSTCLTRGSTQHGSEFVFGEHSRAIVAALWQTKIRIARRSSAEDDFSEHVTRKRQRLVADLGRNLERSGLTHQRCSRTTLHAESEHHPPYSSFMQISLSPKSSITFFEHVARKASAIAISDAIWTQRQYGGGREYLPHRIISPCSPDPAEVSQNNLPIVRPSAHWDDRRLGYCLSSQPQLRRDARPTLNVAEPVIPMGNSQGARGRPSLPIGLMGLPGVDYELILAWEVGIGQVEEIEQDFLRT
ncbi:hypothetical protein FB451DRAFT_1167901 [Mycena latifolia]|nr:hypothetical protein FB451DRAFT_1167901 [Mycena latifolia]